MHRSILITSALCLLLTACAGGGPPPAPLILPHAWEEAGAAAAPALQADWWQGFGSSELSGLVAVALEQSTDLAIAGERVRQAEIQLRIAGASLYPSLDLGVDTGRRRSDATVTDSRTRDNTSASLSARYEIDLWGRNAAAVRAGSARFAASHFDRETLRITLIAGVADAYAQLAALRARLVIAEDNLAIAERVLGIVAARARHGSASQLDLTRQRATVLAQRAALLPLRLQERQTRAALATLIGTPPQGFDAVTGDLYDLSVPQATAGVPADLITRRPDLAASEARLRAAHADVEAARAALLPSLQLAASSGLTSSALLSLADPTHSAAISIALVQNIFDAGRLRGATELAVSRERELLEGYRQIILIALAEVDNALSGVARNAQQEVLQAQVRDAASTSLHLAELRYRAGSDDLLTVLDAQRTLFQAQDQLVQLRLARLQSALSLFRALGGGWHKDADEPSISGTDAAPR